MFSRLLPYLFHDKGPYDIEIISLICGANAWTAIGMTGPSVVKESTENHYS